MEQCAAGMRVKINSTGLVGIVQRRRRGRLIETPNPVPGEAPLASMEIDDGPGFTHDWAGQMAVEIAYPDGRRGWVFAREGEVEAC